MVIKSAFKDYYDFVAHQYGGGDPHIVYVRGSIVPMQNLAGQLTAGVKHVEMTDCPLVSPEYHDFSDYRGGTLLGTTRHTYLVVAGRGYVMACEGGHQLSVSDQRVQPLDYQSKKPCGFWSKRGRDLYGFLPGQEDDFLTRISREIQQPVFVITDVERAWNSSVARVTIHGHCPVLRDVGLPAFVDPYQLYQMLAMFVGNTMKQPPDTSPPVEVENREKILKAGFDLRQSFRHRA